MKKKLFLTLLLSSFISAQSAYAVFDIMAAIQSGLELYKDIENKIQELQKLAADIEKRAKQGFAAASSCFKNPTDCDAGAFLALGMDAQNYVDNKIAEFRVMPGAEELQKGDINKKSSENLMETVRTSYIYKRGQGKDLENLRKNRRGNNAVVTDEVAILFAKGATTRHSIMEEDGELYKTKFDNNNVDEILQAQNLVEIATVSRMARILELKSYMIGAEATVELTRQSIEEKEK